MGCEPDEMGIGPVYSVPKLLKNYNMSVEDIDIWELNEAFAVQVVYCRDKLGIPMDKLNLDGGSISIGHPFGMTGSRQVGHLARQLQNLDKQPNPYLQHHSPHRIFLWPLLMQHLVALGSQMQDI